MLQFDNVVLQQDDFRLSANLSVPFASITAVIGPSGAGKSTLLSLVAGFLHPDHGRIVWQEQDLAPMPPGKRPVSVLFQDQNLFPHLNVAQNVGLGLRPNLRLDAAQRDQIEEALTHVGLGGLGARRPATLSGGQQSRVALARVLLRARPILLLDEPFSALGPSLKSEMLDLVARIAAETRATVLMITHDPADARRIAPQTIVIENGNAHPPAATRPLLDNPPPELRAYLG